MTRPGSRSPSLRPAGFDDLGVRRALSDRLLPCLVAAMTFLAALAGAGAVGAAALAERWQAGAAGTVTVQVPDPDTPLDGQSRLARVQATLAHTAGIRSARLLSPAELRALLRPWLGPELNAGAGPIAIPLPAVIDVRLEGDVPDLGGLAQALEADAPGTMVEEHDRWVARLAALARSLQACAALALALVAFVAVAVVAVATRAGLAARRDAIETVHGLGATDGYIARRFARRVTRLAAWGAAAGALLAVPVLAGLASLAAPFAGTDPSANPADALLAMPLALWLALPALPLIAAAIGWITAQSTVRRWLRRLP